MPLAPAPGSYACQGAIESGGKATIAHIKLVTAYTKIGKQAVYLREFMKP